MKSRVISLADARKRRQERVPHLVHHVDDQGRLLIEYFGADGKLIEVFRLDQENTYGLVIELVHKIAVVRAELKKSEKPREPA